MEQIQEKIPTGVKENIAPEVESMVDRLRRIQRGRALTPAERRRIIETLENPNQHLEQK